MEKQIAIAVLPSSLFNDLPRLKMFARSFLPQIDECTTTRQVHELFLKSGWDLRVFGCAEPVPESTTENPPSKEGEVNGQVPNT